MPQKTLPVEVLLELSAFTESESSDREARASDVAAQFGMTLMDVLSQLEKLRYE